MSEPDPSVTYPDRAARHQAIEFTPEFFARLALARWRLILALTLILSASGVAIILLLPKQYAATATVQVEQRRKQIVAIDAVVQDQKADTPAVESEVEVLASRALALKVIARFKLRTDPEFTAPSWLASLWRDVSGALSQPSNAPLPTPPETRSKPAATPWNDATKQRDEVLDAFMKRVKVARIRNSRHIAVTFYAANAIRAAEIADAIVETYLAAQLEAKASASQRAQKLLSDRIVKMRTRLAAAERKLEDFKTRNDLYDAEGKPILERQLARELETLVRAKERKAAAAARLSLVSETLKRGGDGTELADVLNSATVRLLREGLSRSVRKQAELSTRYGPLHPALRQVAADVAKARAQLHREVQAIIANQRNEFQIASETVASLNQSIVRLKAKIASNKDKNWALAELQRDVETSRTLYEQLLARRKQTRETQGLQFPDATIIERATVPLHPIAPKRKKLAAIAVVASLAMAIGVALALGLLQTLRAASGLTPTMAAPRKPQTALAADTAEPAHAVDHLARLPSLPLISPRDRFDPDRGPRLVLDAPHDPFARAIHALAADCSAHSATRLPASPGFDAASAKLGRVFMIAAPLGDEDRALITANLAHALAIQGNAVCLIDADLRACEVSRAYQYGLAPGLADVLAGSCALQNVVVPARAQGEPHILPAGTAAVRSQSPPTLIEQHNLASVLEAARHAFDCVVIDTPPILAVSDASQVARFADTIVLTVRWQSTPGALVDQALAQLRVPLGSLAGISVTGVPTHMFDDAHPSTRPGRDTHDDARQAGA